jgi:dihydrodipicolinate synthase/N-acetylneuraminate lyase
MASFYYYLNSGLLALPVMIYNYPGAAAGIDLDSDLLIELSEHQNCFGVKVRICTIAMGPN